MLLLNFFPLDKRIETIFKELGWEVLTKHDLELPSLTQVNCIWANPRGYKTYTQTLPSLEKADQFLQQILDICEHFQCPFFIENPLSSNLKSRPALQRYRFHDIWCTDYSYTYKKANRFWTNSTWKPRQLLGLPASYTHNTLVLDENMLTINGKTSKLSSPPTTLIEDIAVHCSPKGRRLLELFAGTKSVGKVFKQYGWEVVSLDINPNFEPDILQDILTWDYTSYPPDYFQCVWASPMCTQYSRARTNAKTPRNLDEADALVKRSLEICAYFGCPFFLENPQTGLLKTRPFMQGVPFQDVTYCSYGFNYQKKTRIWTNTAWLPKKQLCDMKTCHAVVNGRHLQTAQQGPGKDGKGGRTANDYNSLEELFSIPPALVREICLSLNAA